MARLKPLSDEDLLKRVQRLLASMVVTINEPDSWKIHQQEAGLLMEQFDAFRFRYLKQAKK